MAPERKIKENIITNDFKNIFSGENDPTKRNYLKTAERVINNLNEKNWQSPLLIRDLVKQIEGAVDVCKKIQNENKDPYDAGYDVMARVGKLESDLGIFLNKIEGNEFKNIQDLKDEFQEQKEAVQEIYNLITEKDQEMAGV